MRRTHIVVHHTLTKDGQTVSWGAIRKHHRAKGWRDIGYHAGVEDVGGEFEVLIGRGAHDSAAACRQAEMNWVGLHVAFTGNFDEAPPPEPMLRVAVERIIRPWMLAYGIPPSRIIGHRDAGLIEGFDWRAGQYKSCPGKLFDLGALRRIAAL